MLRLILLTEIVTVLVVLFTSQAYAFPSFQEVRDSFKRSEAILLDRHGEIIHVSRVDPKGRRLEWISTKEVPLFFVKAVVRSEDRRFYEHRGVDWLALGTAFVRNIFSEKPRGASTITMQVAGLVNEDRISSAKKRTFKQKWNQIKTALGIEQSWSKDEILEAYLNLVTFRSELQGIAAASRGLFHKEPHGLDDRESVILATLIRSPNAGVADVTRRACSLAVSLDVPVTCTDLGDLIQKSLISSYKITSQHDLAPHVASQFLKIGGDRISTTLDRRIQAFAAAVLGHHLTLLRSQNVRDGAVLVVDNRTGNILAYVASSGINKETRFIDGIKTRRQAGSTLKPFLYGLAIEQGIMTAASLLEDTPLSVATERGLYVPHNYDADFKGFVSLRTSLASSLNVPAVRTLMLIGPNAFANHLRGIGFNNIEKQGEFYGLSLALGAADVTLLELVNAYRTFANGGIWSELTLLPSTTKSKPRKGMSREAAFIISDILSDREGRSITFGLENPLSTRFWSAVKTGTSKDMRDNWCVGYSQYYTVGVWVGNLRGDSMWNVSGVTGAAPIWQEVMSYLHDDKASRPPVPPPGIIQQVVTFQNGEDFERQEWFIKGTETDTAGAVTHKQNARIVYPVSGMIIALDPDIPDERQKVFLQSDNGGIAHTWMLDDQALGKSTDGILWKPTRGIHFLALIDQGGIAIDTARFEVR